MTDFPSILVREFILVAYFFEVQFLQIFWYWVLGMAIGTLVSVFCKERIHSAVRSLSKGVPGGLGIVFASVLGILSPLCMYGTIPIAASFSKSGVRDDWLAAFMTSSVLLNPQLVVYSMALGKTALIARVVSCFLCGAVAGGASSRSRDFQSRRIATSIRILSCEFSRISVATFGRRGYIFSLASF